MLQQCRASPRRSCPSLGFTRVESAHPVHPRKIRLQPPLPPHVCGAAVEAATEGARSALLPQVGGEADSQRQKFSKNNIYPPPIGGSTLTLNTLQLNGSWEIDFFGKNQAALGSVPRSLRDPIATNAVNVGGFLNMLVVARDAGVMRFVYAASSSTYGDHPALPARQRRLSPRHHSNSQSNCEWLVLRGHSRFLH